METYLLDHQYPGSDNNTVTAILYGELGSKDFKSKHEILASYADRGVINYIIRWNVKVLLNNYYCQQLKFLTLAILFIVLIL